MRSMAGDIEVDEDTKHEFELFELDILDFEETKIASFGALAQQPQKQLTSTTEGVSEPHTAGAAKKTAGSRGHCEAGFRPRYG